MKVGISLFMQNAGDWDRFESAERGAATGPAQVPDWKIWEEDLRLGKLIEPLGFDSLWSVEHHFTPYTMVPDVLQLLAYYAGCTERISLGTMVVVLPWHDPIRVAEGIAALDGMLGGRRLDVGFGRGLGRREFGALRIPMEESRERFLESLEIVRRALGNEWFSYDGQHYQIPRTTLRPQARSSDLLEHMYCAWGSPQTIPIAAQTGLKALFIPADGLGGLREADGALREPARRGRLRPRAPHRGVLGLLRADRGGGLGGRAALDPGLREHGRAALRARE